MSKEECCTCSDRLNYVKLCEKYDQLESLHEVLVEDNLTYENQISDLEAKLAEKNRTIDEINKEFLSAIEDWKQLVEIEKSEKAQLKQQLTTQENTITNLVEDNRASQEWYKKQLAENEETIEKLKDESVKYYCAAFNYKERLKQLDQDKISFAVEQLERLKNLCQEKFNWWENSEWEGDIYDKSDVSNAYFDIEANIDEQIAELTHQHEDKGE